MAAPPRRIVIASDHAGVEIRVGAKNLDCAAARSYLKKYMDDGSLPTGWNAERTCRRTP